MADRQLPPYGSQRFCPKCICGDLTVAYVNPRSGALFPGETNAELVPPFLQRICKRCGYRWDEQCASPQQIAAAEDACKKSDKEWKDFMTDFHKPRQFIRETKSGKLAYVWGSMAEPPPCIVDDPVEEGEKP